MRQKFLKNTGPMLSGIGTSEPAVPTTSNESMLFAEGSHASHTVLPENAKAQMTRVTSGESLPELFASLDQGLWLRKTSLGFSQVNLDGSLDEFSATWPRAGMIRNGNAYRLQPLVRLTGETESGLWLTPSATNIGKRSTASLNSRKKYRASIGRKTVPPGNLAEQVQYGAPVTDMVMYPTPTATAGGYNKSPGKNSKPRPTLTTMARKNLWPTPTARDASSRGPSEANRKSPCLDHLAGNGIGGQLNPMWVEWLMGYPTDHTASDV